MRHPALFRRPVELAGARPMSSSVLGPETGAAVEVFAIAGQVDSTTIARSQQRLRDLSAHGRSGAVIDLLDASPLGARALLDLCAALHTATSTHDPENVRRGTQ